MKRLTIVLTIQCFVAAFALQGAELARYAFVGSLTDDSSGSNRDLAEVGGDTQLNCGYATFVGNKNHYLERNGIGGTPNFTVSVWVRASNTNQGGFRGIMSNNTGSTTDFSWQLENHNGKYQIRGKSGNSYVFTIGTPTANVWENIIVRKTGGNNLKVYLNGALVLDKTENPGGLQKFRLGINRNSNSAYAMDLANVRIFNSVEDQAALYAAGPFDAVGGPVISCPPDATVECLDDTSPSAMGTATAVDACGASLAVTSTDSFAAACGGTGTLTRTWTATDARGKTSTCVQTITLVDTIAPVISCDANDIVPADVPVSFTATATDECGSATVSIVSVTAYKIAKNGKIIDKSDSTEIEVNGDTITITDSGGVGTIIEWTTVAVDECGNSTTAVCSVTVVNPGNGGGSSANEGVGNGVDGDTPGHANNGGNDDPEFSKGNPGGKNK